MMYPSKRGVTCSPTGYNQIHVRHPRANSKLPDIAIEENPMRFRLTITAFIVFAALSASSVLQAEQLNEAVFKRLHAELQPAEDELWRTIPWKIDLLDAQRSAASEQKPIFIWAMDGHPLGCT